MPAKKYKTDEDDHSELQDPLVTLASRESMSVRRFFKLLIDVHPKILDQLAEEQRQNAAKLFNLNIEDLPTNPVKSRQDLWQLILTCFLAERPWEQGFKWRRPEAVSLKDGDTGYRQVNVLVPKPLAEKCEAAWTTENQSKASFVWTAMVFFAKYKCPPSVLQQA